MAANEGTGPIFTEDFRRELQIYINVFTKAVDRITKLLAAASNVAQVEPETADEILRSVIVLTHAYLEDLLRTVATVLLPLANERMLNDVPLAGLNRTRAEKFFLGDLAQHKGKTVDEVIHASVSGYLEHRSFNNTTEIISFLESLGVSLPEADKEWIADKILNWPQGRSPGRKETLARVDEMIRRRHHIVHRADQGPKGLQPVDREEVEIWRNATYVLMINVTKACLAKRHVRG